MKAPFSKLLGVFLSVWLLSACGNSATTGDGNGLTDNDALGGDTLVFNPDASDAIGGKDAQDCTTDSDCAGLTVTACQKAVCGTQGTCTAQNMASGTACDDKNGCTTADQCTAGTCHGVLKSCNDQNPCTADTCDPASGQCAYAPIAAKCDDGDLCTQNDACTDGKCTGTPNASCDCKTDADCAKTDDADLCNGVHTCQSGQCLTKPGSAVTCDASKAKPCEIIACDPTDGACKGSPAAEASQCDDGDKCTKADQCAGGVCKGATVVCDDNQVCTDDSCDKVKGCANTPNTAKCDDGDLCTNGDTCAAGVCAGTANPNCSKCTTDADCAKFEDGNLCNGTLACTGGACIVKDTTVVTCVADANPCKTNACVPATGKCETNAALDGSACDDGDACTTGDKCAGGACVTTTAKKCADTNPCTIDSCDKIKGCVFAAADGATCDDGDPCTGPDKCVADKCQGTATGACAKCTTDADCAAYDDKDLCNGTLSCNGGSCSVNVATVVVCDTFGLSPCVKNACTPDTGKCVKSNLSNGSTCDDSNACTEKDYCSTGVCKGKPVYCDDGSFCTDDSCNPDTGCQHVFNSNPCDDGNSCTLSDICKSGSCAGTPVETCSCVASSDCKVYEDGDLCNGTLICAGAKCVVDPKTVVTCSASTDVCTANTCNGKSGLCALVPVADGKVCDDKSACTSGETCAAGKCQGGAAVPCDDKNPCTDDTCNPDFGCTFKANAATCDDGDACTTGDACANSACQPGKTNVCPNACAPAFTLGCGAADAWGNAKSGSTNVVTDYPCNPTDAGKYTGPEFAYLYTAPFDGKVTATLSNETAETDVFILAQGGSGCDAKQCLTFDYASATATVKAGQTYYIVVDGYNGATGIYTLNITCTPAVETNCADGIDEDGDGQTDCADTDCAANAACIAPACKAAFTLTCGAVDSWATTSYGTTNVISAYQGCGNSYAYPAPEYAYTFTSTVTGKVTVTLTNKTAETDIIVLSDDVGVCSSSKCMAFDGGAGAVSFDAVTGATYYFVIDGYNGATGSYTISVACPQAATEICNDGKDNDGDGATDCEDSDCFGKSAACQPACTPDTVELAKLTCAADKDSFQNDGAGSTNVISKYSCSPTSVYSGNEYAYTYVATADTSVTVTLANETADTDILVLQDGGLGCNPASCIATGMSNAQFNAKKGTTYYIVIDGYNGGNGSYDLAFTCQ